MMVTSPVDALLSVMLSGESVEKAVFWKECQSQQMPAFEHHCKVSDFDLLSLRCGLVFCDFRSRGFGAGNQAVTFQGESSHGWAVRRERCEKEEIRDDDDDINPLHPSVEPCGRDCSVHEAVAAVQGGSLEAHTGTHARANPGDGTDTTRNVAAVASG